MLPYARILEFAVLPASIILKFCHFQGCHYDPLPNKSSVTFNADTLENNIMAGNLKPVSILNVLFQIRNKLHFNIKYSTTLYAPCVIMLVA